MIRMRMMIVVIHLCVCACVLFVHLCVSVCEYAGTHARVCIQRPEQDFGCLLGHLTN